MVLSLLARGGARGAPFDKYDQREGFQRLQFSPQRIWAVPLFMGKLRVYLKLLFP